MSALRDLSASGLRPVKLNERPRFGSVWTWGIDASHIRLMAIARLPNPDHAEDDVVFMDCNSGRIDDDWSWVTWQTSDPGVAGWYCVDEGLEGAPYV